MSRNSLLRRSIFTLFSVLLVDQAVKIWIKTHMMLGEEIHVAGNWFLICFTENRGMAFGLEFGGIYGKLFLSVFRIIAVLFIAYYIWSLIRKGAKPGLVICLSLILAGAMGNIIDSAFYGMLFSDSHMQVARFLPEGGGYASFLHGKVVDMFYFPIIDTTWPMWMPVIGGQHFIFFSPIFNFADAAISCGIIALLLFYSKYLNESYHHKN